MSLKIRYYTAGPVPTSAETAQIETIKAIAAAPYELIVENGAPRASITGIKLSAAQADNSYNDAGATITGTGIAAVASDNSLTDSGNGFVTAGFKPGDTVTISGFTGETSNNASDVRVVSVAAGKMVVEGITLKNDSAGESVTVASGGRFLQRGFKVGDYVMVRGFTGNTANNINSGKITALTALKMTIGGTDGDVIVNDAAGEAVTICTVATDANYGSSLTVSDFVAGTVPEAYKTNGTAIYTVFDPANPPDVAALIDTQTVLSDAETIELDTAGTVTVTVADGAISAADVAATEAVVTNGDTVAIGSDDITLAVADHVITPSIGATKAIVATTQEIAITSGSGSAKVTLTIAGGLITACVLS
jgi:hypothetical protein